ncbi:hypothetical protein GTA51_04790 [Desulfovibrio aerotolerans]|uniref:Uncharacterized protein n=1 Tax=Solidesulfovibrio aerotolerans TaxID=295255 RepID=A0A7C9N4I2_9BACT|nr:hypothetical protein [Solidesulfovibrio aerotolerans]MYL82455.1 hypothetical protein [Solidesulfovibrio aerotolerans]
MSNNKPFKTTWAGMNDKIHTPKLTRSVGKTGFEANDARLEMEKSKSISTNKIHDPDFDISPNHKWLMIRLFLKQMHHQ